MGYHRMAIMPPDDDRFHLGMQRLLEDIFAEQEATFVCVDASLPPPDPFGIAHNCSNAGGHVFIQVREGIVCEHCSRIVWP